MKLYTLGTSHGGTEAGRACSGNLFEIGGDYYLFDCGCDVESKMKDMGLPIGKIKAVFVSHMHGDHVVNLPAIAKCFVCGYSKMDTVLGIYMPSREGLDAFKVWARAMSLDTDSGKLVLNTFSEGIIYKDDNVCITAIATEHLGASKPSFAFMLETADGKRVLYTGDLSCDFHDYPTVVFEKDFDAILSELVHFDIEKNFDTVAKSRTKEVIFTHMSPRSIGILEKIIDNFPYKVQLAKDGMEFEI